MAKKYRTIKYHPLAKKSVINKIAKGFLKIKKEEKLDRFLNAINSFGGRYYGDDEQILKDLKIMNKAYEKGGRWQEGKLLAQKTIFNKIFGGKRI